MQLAGERRGLGWGVSLAASRAVGRQPANLTGTNLSSRDPDFMRTLLADNVFVFQGLRKKVAVVAEVQTARPKRSRSLAWPAYLANARAILGCDAVLCVFGLSADAVLGACARS